jgi:threonine/homoserine/homoserine lactone efflux protein
MMFDYGWVHWGSFFAATFLLNAAPGPDLGYVFAQTLKNGRAGGFAAMFGIWAGAFGHVFMAAVGLSALLAASATVFATIKWLGAAYLVWLGIDAFRSAASSGQEMQEAGNAVMSSPSSAIFLQGAVIALLNPKTAIFFLAFLPQFVVEGAGTVSQQLLLHGALVVVLAAFIDPWVVLLGEKLSASLNRNSQFATFANRLLGTVFIGLGIRLVFMNRW